MSRFMGAVFGQQLRAILEHHYGPEQHGFRKGHSTVSLLHILEVIIDEAKAGNTEVVIVQIDVAKAFDKIDRKAVESFAKIIVARSAPEAAKFISDMYKRGQSGDKFWQDQKNSDDEVRHPTRRPLITTDILGAVRTCAQTPHRKVEKKRIWSANQRDVTAK